MGLLDINTVKACYKEARKIKEDAILYGEGWDMGEELPSEEKASKNNASLLKEFGFFNDSYRDIVKGPSSSFNLHEKGYICGNTDYVFGLDYVFHASVLPLSYQPMFNTANQSINYLECHDNSTLFDKLLVSNAFEEEKVLLDRVDLANHILLLSFGVPLVHAGQEIGQSKDGLDNTYKTIGVNNLNYRLIDERFDMVNRFRLFNILRKKLAYTHLFKPEEIKNVFEISHWDNGVYLLSAKNKNIIDNEKEFVILINPKAEKIPVELDNYYTEFNGVDDNRATTVKNSLLPGCSLKMLFLKK
jgi:pullulanase